MYTFERNGKTINCWNCAGGKQEEMLEHGWRMILAEFRESPAELYDRLIAEGYSKVRVCWVGTMVRGIHDYFAFVKA